MKEAHGKLWDSVNKSKKQVKLNSVLLKSVYKCGKKKNKEKQRCNQQKIRMDIYSIMSS